MKILITVILAIILTGCANFDIRCSELWQKALPWSPCPYCEHNRRPDKWQVERIDMGDGYTKVISTYQFIDMEGVATDE